ncbi:hypothetical protein D0A39_14965 [Xanthomonas campestris pv. campestris]|jgi:hypothetical protein|nr:hypothetical protein D0A39_14965 [Xanthomonas campestris pv. campestris]
MTQARVAPAYAVMLWVRWVRPVPGPQRVVRAPQVLAMQRAMLVPEQAVLQVALWRWATLPTQAQAVSPSLQVRQMHRVPVAPHHAGTAVES